MRIGLTTIGIIVLLSRLSLAAEASRKVEYVRAVTRGAGLMPWQEPGVSAAEREFRTQIEARKTELLGSRVAVRHPVMISPEDIERARRNIASADWARQWAEENREVADHVLAQPVDYLERMIPELTPTNTYGFTCAACVGVKSQEGMGASLMRWDHRNPDVCSCKRCGQVYPSEKYAETAQLVCPRSGQTFTYYLNERERANPDDRSGALAWHWVGRPLHMSYTGQIRAAKIRFMMQAAQALAMQYTLSGEPAYAVRTKEVLCRFARCYRQWLYHDYWDTIADCDPMYAAWHDNRLPLEWKRHLCEQAFRSDTLERARMLQSYWGAGRVHPSTDGIAGLPSLAIAYDLVHDAVDASGQPIWTDGERQLVERDLLLEYVMGAEPFVGGAGKADCVNNKAPAVYRAMAVVGRVLGLAPYVDTALRGYEGVRDRSFIYDGFSHESPSYTNMFMGELVQIPEDLHGFEWPAGFPGRSGVVDLYASDSRLRLMYRAMLDQLRPDGRYLPLSDTNQLTRPSSHLVDLGAKRYPEYYRGTVSRLGGGRGLYALLKLSPEEIAAEAELNLPEILFPAWMTAVLRHGRGPNAAVLAMPFNPHGGHRHTDNLALFYSDGGTTILGDHGYMGNMPVNAWIKSTFSHNLVVVDDAEQRFKERVPRLVRMFTSPRVSVVEAASDCYAQCSEYSRLVVLIKGPAGRTFVVDVFRVTGGRKHSFRVHSEIASSDAADGEVAFVGLPMPPEPPLPKVGASLAREDIFGLRDVRSVKSPPDAWQAIWKEAGRRYRMWMLGPVDRVEASNGPGQETLAQPGRRVRYVDAIREGDNLTSTFVAVHEPSGDKGVMPIRNVRLLALPASAGPQAVALRIESAWGTYTFLNRIAGQAEVEGVTFQGEFALLHQDGDDTTAVCNEAVLLKAGDLRFSAAAAAWSGPVASRTETTIVAGTPRPADWPALSSGVQQYMAVRTATQQTGLPVRSTDDERIEIERFPVPEVVEFRLPNLVVLE
ncbi:MAG TPA: heparinase II/III family protein [Phycisphaerae bacterium]|nr:heparinase II/III family protein [Phycisphaerae bacterium]